jgi:hypothetical protein
MALNTRAFMEKVLEGEPSMVHEIYEGGPEILGSGAVAVA